MAMRLRFRFLSLGFEASVYALLRPGQVTQMQVLRKKHSAMRKANSVETQSFEINQHLFFAV